MPWNHRWPNQKLTHSPSKRHPCLCPSPYCFPAALHLPLPRSSLSTCQQGSQRPLSSLPWFSCQRLSLACANFLTSMTWPMTSPTSSRHHPTGTQTLISPYSSLSCKSFRLLPLHLLAWNASFHLTNCYVSGSTQESPPDGSLPPKPPYSHRLSYTQPHLSFQNWIITAPKKYISFFLFHCLVSLWIPQNSIFSSLKHQGWSCKHKVLDKCWRLNGEPW